MARSVTKIQQEIFNNISQNEDLQSLNATSKVAIWRLIVFIVSYSIWTLEVLFDTHVIEIDKEIIAQKRGTLPWYRTMALQFQYGFDLLTDSDKFYNGVATPEQIEDSKLIKYAAVNDGDLEGVVVIKIAGETNGKLSPITDEQKTSVAFYFNEIKYAGSRISIINFLPDRLYLNIKIYRDPLVLDSNGNSIVNGGKPVETAINEFMKELPFNGELIIVKLVDKLQKAEGVRIPHVLEVASSWIDAATDSYGMPSVISVKNVPKSGYYEVVNFDNITYVV
jgi:hypothetical protein